MTDGDHDKTCPSCGGQGCESCDHTGHVPAPVPTTEREDTG